MTTVTLLVTNTIDSIDSLKCIYEHIAACKDIVKMYSMPGFDQIKIIITFQSEESADMWVGNLPYSIKKLEVLSDE